MPLILANNFMTALVHLISASALQSFILKLVVVLFL